MDSSPTIRTAGRVAAFAVLACGAIACGDDSPTTGDDGATTLSVYLKDAPGDVDSVWVQVDDVVLVGDGGTLSLLDEPSGLLNVTSLRDSASLLVGDFGVAAGHYGEIRFVLGGAVLQSGTRIYTFGDAEHPGGEPATGSLQCPSCGQSGLKVKMSGGLDVADGENAILLDFDVAQSFGHIAGQSGKWIMHPVIHAVAADAGDIENDEAVAQIRGAVALGEGVTLPVCGGATRTLASFIPQAVSTTLTDVGGEPLTFSGHVEDDAAFEIELSDYDAFTLGYDDESTFDTEKLVWSADVDPVVVTLTPDDNEAVDGAYTITAVTCEPHAP